MTDHKQDQVRLPEGWEQGRWEGCKEIIKDYNSAVRGYIAPIASGRYCWLAIQLIEHKGIDFSGTIYDQIAYGETGSLSRAVMEVNKAVKEHEKAKDLQRRRGPYLLHLGAKGWIPDSPSIDETYLLEGLNLDLQGRLV